MNTAGLHCQDYFIENGHWPTQAELNDYEATLAKSVRLTSSKLVGQLTTLAESKEAYTLDSGRIRIPPPFRTRWE